MQLETKYLGLTLKNPLIAGASPFADDLDKVRALEDYGISAITMYSLFEEQITHNQKGALAHIGSYENSFSEASSYFPNSDLLDTGVETYLNQLSKVKAAVGVPVIGSLNGWHAGDWVRYAKQIEAAGADALELNLYFLPIDLSETSGQIEDRCIAIVSSVRSQIDIPLAIKLSPFYTGLPHFANRLTQAGADGIVCFNRFYQPDIDIEAIDIEPTLQLSDPRELRLRLRWLAMLSDRIPVDLAVSGGVHGGKDAIKAIMAGAHGVQLVSTLLQRGASHVARILEEMAEWAADHEYSSVDELRGCMNYMRCPDPEALERANYMRILKSWQV